MVFPQEVLACPGLFAGEATTGDGAAGDDAAQIANERWAWEDVPRPRQFIAGGSPKIDLETRFAGGTTGDSGLRRTDSMAKKTGDCGMCARDWP